MNLNSALARLILGAAAAMTLSRAGATECGALEHLELAQTEITFAGVVEAGSFTPPAGAAAAGQNPYSRLPSFCRVAGTLRPTSDSDIRFEVWMPLSGWNGKFVGVGNGAWAGSITYAAMINPLASGYATAATDDGHQGDPLDARFAAGYPEKFVDFGHRAVHATTVAAKAVVNSFYGRGASRSLFASCSTGGRQALMEAYRYPQDYDGISAMAPANPMVSLMVSSLWTGSATAKEPASRMTQANFDLVHEAAVAACDAEDGIKDGLISAPERCHFDPATLQCNGASASSCLTAPQVAAMRAIYAGPSNPRTRQPIFPGFEPGSEAMLSIQASGAEPFPAAMSYFRDLVFHDANWNFRTFDYDTDVARARQAHSAIVDIPPSGLAPYLRSGRKLLLFHGWADPLIPPRTSVDFYKELVAHLGRQQAESARLFMIPGMGHCGGGDGPSSFDAIALLDEWVETRRAPTRIVVSNSPAASHRTRPLCPYPLEAVYSGAGSTDDEHNFQCKSAGR